MHFPQPGGGDIYTEKRRWIFLIGLLKKRFHFMGRFEISFQCATSSVIGRFVHFLKDMRIKHKKRLPKVSKCQFSKH